MARTKLLYHVLVCSAYHFPEGRFVVVTTGVVLDVEPSVPFPWGFTFRQLLKLLQS